MTTTINASTSAGLVESADTSGQLDLQSNGVTKVSVSSTGVALTGASMTSFAGGVITQGTAVASTSGTSIDFTSIPSWVKRITIMLGSISTSGISNLQVQLGTGSTTYTTTGYSGSCNDGTSVAYFSAGFVFRNSVTAASAHSGMITIVNLNGNAWVENGVVGTSATNYTDISGGSVSLAAALTAVRVTTANGTDTFDAGTINILYEG